MGFQMDNKFKLGDFDPVMSDIHCAVTLTSPILVNITMTYLIQLTITVIKVERQSANGFLVNVKNL